MITKEELDDIRKVAKYAIYRVLIGNGGSKELFQKLVAEENKAFDNYWNVLEEKRVRCKED